MHYDAIVMGLGGVGSVAAYHLAKRGLRVLGIDQFAAGHDRGSSHGETRVIRQAYFEHPNYVPLLRTAYARWAELESEVNEKLFHRVGIVQVGPADGVILPGVLKSASLHGLTVETLDHDAYMRRWPGIAAPEGWQAVYESNAGYLMVERCVLAHLELAARMGATLRHEQSVVDWKANRDGTVQIQTDRESHTADRLVIAAGAWAPPIVARYGMRLEVRSKWLYWYQPDANVYDQGEGFPCFFFESPSGYFYGFPRRDALGVKLAQHSGGQVVVGPEQDVPNEDCLDRSRCDAFLRQHLPQLSDRCVHSKRCYYTMSPDEHFIVDRLPDAPQITIVAGLSGHGFKFASVLGETACQLTVDGVASHDIAFLRIDRG
jgi:sarcosine oxidase